MRRKKLTSFGVFALLSLVAGAQAQVTLTAKAGFGVGGWVAPVAASTTLDIGSLTRGFAYDQATNQLVVVNRQGGVNLNLLNASTGALNGQMSNAGLTGGTFLANQVGVGTDGKVYVANLATATGGLFKIYEFGSASIGATGSAVYTYTTTAPDARIGDSFDVFGGGSSLAFVAGVASPATTAGYHTVNSAFAGSTVAVAGTSVGDFRLGVTFGATSNDIFGTQGAQNLRVTQGGTLQGTGTLLTGSARPMDFAVINGVSLLATIDTVSSQVQVYDMANPLSPVFIAQGNNTTGSLTANGNGVGQVKFAQDASGAWSLYAMSTNQGIQAYDLQVVPEPATMLVLAGAAAIAARRRKKA
ncbi:MAG: PEP-CTERM sorting domain-containing protein [Fimbriimonadaceae bacterium]